MRYPFSVTSTQSLRKYYKTHSGVDTFMPTPEYFEFPQNHSRRSQRFTEKPPSNSSLRTFFYL